jgi:CrcB protein
VQLLWIAIGGGIGSVLRYALSTWTQRATGAGPFPAGTLLVNVLGCFAMGALCAEFAGPGRVREETRLFLLVGLLGGFTTFSTFAWDTFGLMDGGDRGRALANLLLSNGLGLAAVWAGYRLVVEFRGA